MASPSESAFGQYMQRLGIPSFGNLNQQQLGAFTDDPGRYLTGAAMAAGLIPKHYKANPFTDYAVNLIQTPKALQNLFDIFAPAGSAALGDTGEGLYGYGQKVLQSFFGNGGNTTVNDVGGNAAFGGLNPLLYNTTGQAIYDVLKGVGPGGSGIIAQEIKDAPDSAVFGYVKQMVGLLGDQTMSSTMMNLVQSQLEDQYNNYLGAIAQGTNAGQNFADWLVNNASGWLFKWWNVNQNPAPFNYNDNTNTTGNNATGGGGAPAQTTNMMTGRRS